MSLGDVAPGCDRDHLGQATESDSLSKAMEDALGPGAGLQEAASLLVLILGCLGCT